VLVPYCGAIVDDDTGQIRKISHVLSTDGRCQHGSGR